MLHLGTGDLEIAPDHERPVYFRALKGKLGIVELNFFATDSLEAISKQLFYDCRNDLDLILKRPS